MSRKKSKDRHGKLQENKAAEGIHSRPIPETIPEPGPEKKAFYNKPLNLAVIILVLTFIAFFPSLRNDFVPTWDDSNYVTQNPRIQSLNAATIKQMFTRQVNGTYVPLPLLTYAIEYKLSGNNPAPFHRTNLILHLLSTLLIFQLFRLLKIDLIYAAFGALLFGIHPMRVESVAWISERKDVLYVFFYTVSLVFYVKHIRREKGGSRFFLLSLLFFLFSLLSKIAAVTLPLSLLLIDYFTGRPLKLKLIKEKIPFFILSLLFGGLGVFIILWIGRKAGLLRMNEVVGLGDRIIYGMYALNGYIVKFLVPVRQSAIYPYPEYTGAAKILFYILNPVLLLALAYLVYRTVRYTRAIIFGTLFFVASIIFLLQVFAVGNGFFADRYTYIPYTGFIFIVAWSAEHVVKKRERLKYLVLPVLAIVSVILMALTFNRCKIWKNDETLWTNVIEQYPDKISWPYANRGVYYMNNKETDKAVADFSTAISIDPKCEAAYSDRGMLYGLRGEYRKAVADFSMTVSLDPENLKARNNRGVAYGNLGQTDQAISDFSRVIAMDSNYSQAYLNLANIFYRQKRFDSAIAISRRGLNAGPQNGEFWLVAGNSFLEKEDYDKAIDQFNKCLAVDGSDFDAMLGLAVAYYNKNDKDNSKKYLLLAEKANDELTFGMAGIKTLEKSGYSVGDKKRVTLERMFGEIK